MTYTVEIQTCPACGFRVETRIPANVDPKPYRLVGCGKCGARGPFLVEPKGKAA